MKPKVIIIGAGIGGLAAGIAAARSGYRVEVYERAPELLEVGAGLSLWANAVRALRKLGLGGLIDALGVPEVSGALRDWRGKVLVEGSSAALSARYGDLSVMVYRPAFLAALLEALGEEAVTLGKSCIGFSQNQRSVTAFFADGSEARGELLIGADGLHSAVRAGLHGEAKPRYAGYTAWRSAIPFDPEKLEPGETWGRGKRFGQFPMANGLAYWFATANALEGGRSPSEKAHLQELFKGWHRPIEALLGASDESRILRHDIYDRAPLPRWGAGRVTLLGDAAHPMTPDLGQGACQAIEDAACLLEVLPNAADPVAALRRYEAKRIPRTRFIVQQSRRLGRVAQWQQPLAASLRDVLVSQIPASLQNRALERILGYDP